MASTGKRYTEEQIIAIPRGSVTPSRHLTLPQLPTDRVHTRQHQTRLFRVGVISYHQGASASVIRASCTHACFLSGEIRCCQRRLLLQA